MITRGNSFKLLLPYIFLEDTKYMTILTRQERERLVLEPYYNQGKTYCEISKVARISPRDIGIILNEVIEEKTEREEGIKRDDAEKNQQQEQQQHPSLSTQAYNLLSERKTPLEVAITLNIGESGATKFYREYRKLKQLHNLNMVYEETKGDIAPFLKLYRLSKAAGMSARHVVNLLKIANTDLLDIQCRYERLKGEVSTLGFNKQQSHKAIAYFNEKTRIEDLVTQFKSNNEEYLKIKQAAEEKVKDV
jgi:hypothetical protein